MSQRTQVTDVMEAAQTALITAFEAIDGEGTFRSHRWERPGGGGGHARVLEQGRVFERAGVNYSAVMGERVPESLARQHPGTEGKPFFATGVSLVLHPQNPYVPAFHANYRYFEIADGEVFWFGGGADMTPNYPFEDDIRHFHATLKAQCDRFDPGYYPRFKAICDSYFYIKHRREMRGVGGIFFDELQPPAEADFAHGLAFAEHGLATIPKAYLPIVERRMATPFGDRQRQWQLYRRGRYVEFNLVYDRGTLFGLQTGGNIEAILMSMPPYAHWAFDYQPEAGTPEARMPDYLQPRDWV
jgi:coproporphyrinogen III oxidase